MSPLVVTHVTRNCSRQSISERGLLCSVGSTIFGVYTYCDNGEFDHPTRGRSPGASRVYWSAGKGQDVWRIAYIGPVTPDPYVMNGLVLLEPVPPEQLELVST